MCLYDLHSTRLSICCLSVWRAVNELIASSTYCKHHPLWRHDVLDLDYRFAWLPLSPLFTVLFTTLTIKSTIKPITVLPLSITPAPILASLLDEYCLASVHAGYQSFRFLGIGFRSASCDHLRIIVYPDPSLSFSTSSRAVIHDAQFPPFWVFDSSIHCLWSGMKNELKTRW